MAMEVTAGQEQAIALSVVSPHLKSVALQFGICGVMPQTDPVPPPAPPREEPAPLRKPPPSKPQRKLDPFNPDWPKTRPTPEPKAEA